MAHPRPYAGKLRDRAHYEAFRSDVTPTEESHPQYSIVVGPFRTVGGRDIWIDWYNAGGSLTQENAEKAAARRRAARRQTR